MKSPSPESLRLVKEFALPSIAFGVARVPGSGRTFFGGSDFKVREADVTAAKFEPRELYAHESYVTTVALTGARLVSGGYDGKLVWWDTAKGEKVRTTAAHARWVRQVVASPDGTLVASVADDMVCKLWDAETGELVREMRGHAEKTPTHFTSMLYAVAFSADGKFVATGDKVGHVVVWEAGTGKSFATLEAPVMYTWDKAQRNHSIGGIRSLAFSPDGERLAVGGMGKVGNIDHLEGKARVEVFDWKAGTKPAVEFQSDKFAGVVNALRFAPDGAWLLGAGGAAEGFFLFADVAAKKLVRQEKVGMHVHDVALSDRADVVTAAGHNKLAVYAMG
jgi:WD40 repeat protein